MTETTATHRASLGAILSVLTGVLVCPLDEMYDLQNFLVGRDLMTHERIVGNDRQEAALLAQFPRLAEATPPDFSAIPRADVEDACRAWVDSVAEHIGWTEANVQAVSGCEVDMAEAFENMLAKLGTSQAGA